MANVSSNSSSSTTTTTATVAMSHSWLHQQKIHTTSIARHTPQSIKDVCEQKLLPCSVHVTASAVPMHIHGRSELRRFRMHLNFSVVFEVVECYRLSEPLHAPMPLARYAGLHALNGVLRQCSRRLVTHNPALRNRKPKTLSTEGPNSNFRNPTQL